VAVLCSQVVSTANTCTMHGGQVNNRLQFVPKMHRVSARWQVYPAMLCRVQLLLQTVGLTAIRTQVVIKGCRPFGETVTGSFDRSVCSLESQEQTAERKEKTGPPQSLTAVHCHTCAATLQHRCQGPPNTTQQRVFLHYSRCYYLGASRGSKGRP
jgi:hypothetical protein